MEKEREREENECTKMLKSAQVRKDGCGAGFVSTKGLPKKQWSSVDCCWNHTHTQHWVMG
jgi:hypothetical protein